MGGHRAEFAVEHAQAAAIQAHPSPSTALNGRLRRSPDPNRHLIVYYGEATQSFWAITPTGMVEARDVDVLLLVLWPHTDPPAARPWARAVGRAPVPVDGHGVSVDRP